MWHILSWQDFYEQNGDGLQVLHSAEKVTHRIEEEPQWIYHAGCTEDIRMASWSSVDVHVCVCV